MFKIVLASVVGIVAGTQSSFAQQGTVIKEGHLTQLDTNKNGGVSKSEYETFMTEAFTKLDANSDGTLSKAEVKGVLTDVQFAEVDVNNNGSVTRTEFMTQVMKDFASADHSGDGQLK